MTAVITVSAQGEQRAAGLQLMGVGGGLARLVLDPAEGSGFVLSLKDLQFAVGCGGSGEVGDEGRFFAGRYGDANGVGAEHAFDGKGRCDEGACVGHGDTDHLLPDGGQGMVAGNPKVVGVLNADPASAAGGCFSDGDLHGIGGYDKTQAAVAVDDGSGGGLVQDTDGGARVGPPRLLEANIPYQTCYTVRINSAEVCAHECCSGSAGILLRAAHPP